MTFSIKTFSTLTTVKVEERGTSQETVFECSWAVFLESFGNKLSVPVERCDLYRKYWSQVEDPAGTERIWEACVFSPQTSEHSGQPGSTSLRDLFMTFLYTVLLFVP